MLIKKSSIPLYYQAANWLRECINKGEFKAGDQIPSEGELASTLGISRMTARQAITELVREGLLYRRAGKGTFLASSPTFSKLSTLVGFSEKMQKIGKTVKSKVLFLGVKEADAIVAKKLGLTCGQKIIEIKRLRYLDNEPVTIQLSYLPYDKCAPLMDVDLTKESLVQSVIQKCGIPLKSSVDTVSIVSVFDNDAKLLDVEDGSPAFLIEGIIYSHDGLPIRFGRGIYKGNCFKLTVENISVE